MRQIELGLILVIVVVAIRVYVGIDIFDSPGVLIGVVLLSLLYFAINLRVIKIKVKEEGIEVLTIFFDTIKLSWDDINAIEIHVIQLRREWRTELKIITENNVEEFDITYLFVDRLAKNISLQTTKHNIELIDRRSAIN